jgi:DNA invertase Pin-like site-specific DNA recombinase
MDMRPQSIDNEQFFGHVSSYCQSWVGALAEFERNLIRERTNAGLQAARSRGRKGGRPKSLTDKKTAMAQALYNDKNNTVDEICKTLNISRATLYRYVQVTPNSSAVNG